jgi:AraC-like DNA-binding protein
MKNSVVEVSKEELMIEVHEIKNMLNLLSDLFSIRTSFIYAIDEEQYANEIAGYNGEYQEFCSIIQQEFRSKCVACDYDKFKEALNRKEPLLYRCYNGLYEMFSPLFIDDLMVGYLHFGQVRAEDDFETIASECSLYKHTRVKELEKVYNSMNIINKEKLILISKLFKKFSEIIINNKLIRLREKRPEYYLKKYVEENLSASINVKTAAEYVHRSPSYVTHKFREIYGKTFHEYVYQARIEYSKKLLREKSISDIYQLCGFNNRYHFSRVFKSLEKITPHEYQLLVREEKS